MGIQSFYKAISYHFPRSTDSVYKRDMLVSSAYIGTRALICFRALTFLALLQTCILPFIAIEAIIKTMCIFTSWALLCTTMTFFSLIVLHLFSKNSQKDYDILIFEEARSQQNEWNLWKVVHILYEVSVVSQFVSTATFWTVLYSSEFMQVEQSNAYYWFMIEANILPFVALLVDLCLCRLHFIPRHFWLVALFGSLYMGFNAAVTLNSKSIYPYLTWNSWVSALVCALVFLGIFLGFLMGSIISKIKHAAEYGRKRPLIQTIDYI